MDLPRSARVDLRVLDVPGRMVRVVANSAFDAGFLMFAWDGAGEGGRRAAAGLYFARLIVDGRLAGTRRIALTP